MTVPLAGCLPFALLGNTYKTGGELPFAATVSNDCRVRMLSKLR